MPAPAVDPDFATDAAYPTDGDDWDGAPTKVDPGGTVRARGFEPGELLAAEHLNFMIGNHGDWLAWHNERIEGIHPSTGGDAGGIVYPAALTVRRVFGTPFHAYGDPTDWALAYATGDMGARPLASAAPAFIEISIPPRVTVTEVRVGLNCSSSRAGGNRWQATLTHLTQGHIGETGPNFFGTVVSSIDDGGAVGATFLAWTGLTLAPSTTYQKILIEITGPDTPIAGDALCSTYITGTSTGPDAW